MSITVQINSLNLGKQNEMRMAKGSDVFSFI